MRLKELLASIVSEFTECELLFEPFAAISNFSLWLSRLVAGKDEARSHLCGTATLLACPSTSIAKEGRDLSGSKSASSSLQPVAIIDVTFPSDVSVTFPLKKTPAGSGVRMQRIDLTTAETFIRKELSSVLQKQ